MSIDIRLPNITAATAEGQMAEMQSYMYQLVQQLNWALNTIGEAQNGNTANIVINSAENNISPEQAADTFNSIKALIIKSADIVKAYEETIKTDFNGEYFADSDFGTYLNETRASIIQNSQGIQENYTSVQTLKTDFEEEVKDTNAYIKRGLLGYDSDGNAIYGVAVGQTTSGVYNKYAWFTAEKLSFFDSQGNEVAYIGSGSSTDKDTKCLYILGKAVFLGEMQIGGYKIDASDGLAFTWIV